MATGFRALEGTETGVLLYVNAVAPVSLTFRRRITTGGFSLKRLTRVRDLLTRHVDAGYVPGAVAVVARHGEVHIEATGNLAFEGAGSRTPMAPDTICRIASMSKPIVAACVMTLVEDCTLRLDDPVDELLPELADMTVLADPNGPLDDTVPAKRPITVRDLLTYSLGTGSVVAEPGTVPISDALGELERGEGPLGRDPSPDEWIRRLGTLPLVYRLGERWMYHTAANVTGVLIARATGVSYQRGDATDEIVVEDGPDGYWSKPPAFEEGGSGLVSTASDHLAFASALLAGGTQHGERTLSRPSVTLMTSDHMTPAQKAVSGFSPGDFDDIGWGFGMSVRTRRTHLGPSVGSYGPSRGHDDNPHDAAGA